MYDINLFSGNQRWNPNEGNVPQGYSFGTQAIDAMSNSSITVREMLYDEMTREKTLAEQQNIRDFLVANIKARESEQLGGWSRFASGWENASLQEDIAMAANEIRSIKAKGGDQELEQELQDRIARYKWRQSQITTPQDTGMWSAYNIGMVGRSMVSGFALEALFGAGELMLGAALAPVTGAGSITAATILAGRRYLRARKIAKGAYAAGKALGMWESFSRREEGSMYSDIMDRNDLTEDQKQAMAVTYGRLSGAVELLGWNLGAGGLAVKGAKAISKKIASPVDKWAADAAFKNTIKNQMKEEASKTFGAKLMTGIKGTARVTASTAAEVAEEGTQKALETTVVQQGLAGKTPTVTSDLAGGFEKLAGVPVELVQGKLSEESIAILEAMGAALLPSVLVGGGGYVLSSAASYGAEVLPADTGRISWFTMKNNALKSAILSAEKNVARLTAISNFMGDASKTSDVKLQLIDGMVKNAELEGAVHFAPEDTEVLLALGESKPTLKNTMARLGITKAIKEGQKTGTVSIPMQAFAELVSQPEVREGEVGKQLNVSGTVSLEDSSYSRIQRNVIAGQKKGKELLAKPSAKLEQKLNGLRRRFKAAGYADEEIEANLATFTSALATLAEASNGAVTTDELIDDFKFNIEKRDFDINSKDIESTVKKILADDREVLGYFRRVREKDRKPLPKDVAKLNIESVAAEMARIDANEKEYTGETIKINGKERSVYNSHGVRIAKSAKALKAFYKWFGNSKAVDEQGRPKVLYHGTPRASFLNFVGKDGKQRFFFTDDISIAETYSGSSHIVTREEAEGAAAGDIDPSAGIYQVYLKIENPEEVDYNGKPWVGNEDIALNIQMEDGTLATDKDGSPILITTMEEAAEFFKSGTYGQASLVPAPGIVASTDMEAKKAKIRGHDGAILKNVLDVGDMARRPENEYPVSTVYVTFEPEQIKSTDNYGMFDPDAVEMYRSVIRTAYAGSPVDYLLPALKAIGTGEWHYAHGWGLYYALRFDVADRYRKSYATTFLDERLPVSAQTGYVKRALNEMFAKEKSLAPVKRNVMVGGNASESHLKGKDLYDGMVNHFLGKLPFDFGGDYDKKTVYEAKKKASLMLHKYGISGITYKGAEDGDCIVVFDPSILRVKESYYSRRKDVPATTPESEFDLFSEDTGIRGKKELFVAKHADITTFAHEVMHFVTRGLVEMYNDGSISEVWKREIEKLYDYFSTMPSRRGPSAMHKKGNKIVMETEASETLSGGFQQYIERGEASDSALEKLYAYIKDLAADLWAVLNRGYYKDQALSDTQILFYDKVMSAHTDVKNTEYKYGYAPLDKLPGVSDEEYEEYTIERKVSRAKSSNTLFKSQRQMVKNRKRKEWIKFYDEEFIKALNELRGEPEYMVMQFIKDNGGLNKDSFKSGTRLWGSVPQRYFSKKDDEGVTVEQLSAKFGPEISIADIAKILASMPSLDVAARRRARTEADRRFLEEFNPAADITPANAMRTILFIRSLVKESLMIKGEPLSSFPAHYGVWIKEAENYFMGLTVKNAKDLEKWANMESRVTDDFMAAFTGGNTDLAALKADQRAMVNYVMVRSKQLRKQEASFKRRFKKFYSAPKGKDIKIMDGVTWNLIHTILQEYGFTRKSGRLSASAKEQFSAWIEARKGKKYFPYETLVNEIGLLSSIPKNTSLTVERFNRVVALVETIRAVGEAEKRVFDGIKREQLDVVAGQIIDNIMKIRATKGDKAFLAYGKGSLSRLTVPQMGMLEPLFGEMGMQKLYVALRNALVARDDLADNTRTFIADSFERNGIGNLLADKREFMVGNRVVTNNILLFALQHSGNDHNRDNAIKTLQQYYKDESFSEAEFEDLLNASPAGMRNYVNDLWAMFKNMKNLIDEQTRVATGELIATVEPKSYTLRDGTKMSGGYFPAKKVNKVGITDPLDTYYDNNFLYPRAGLLKDRIKNATGNLDLSQDSLSRWIFQAVNLATTQVAFNDIATIFQDEAVINALGPNASLVTQYVNDWLQAAVMPIAPQPKTLRAIAKGPTVVFLGFKAVSGLVQLLGTLVGLNEVSMPSLLASSGKLLNVGKYFKISEEMGKRSAFMADRARKFDSRFFGLMKDENMLQKATRKYGDGLVTASMSFVRTFQCMADMVVWDGAFADAKKNGMSDKDASDHADYVVMKTQGDRVQMNTPEGFQGILRFFQPFMTYILTLSQMGNAALRSKNFKKFGTLVALIVLSNALEAYFKENDKEWRRKLLGKKTKGTDRDFWQRYRNRFLVQTVSTLGDVAFPFAGLGGTLSLTMTEDMLKSVSPGYRAYSAGATPAVEVVTKAAKAITLDEKTWKSIYDWDMSLGANLVDFVL